MFVLKKMIFADMRKWKIDFWSKILLIIEEERLFLSEIPDYFLFENMRLEYPNFCRNFKIKENGEVCHLDIPREKFCCLFCACPFFTLDDKRTRMSCGSNKEAGYREGNIWDCSGCSYVHDVGWVRENLSFVEEMMKSKEGEKND